MSTNGTSSTSSKTTRRESKLSAQMRAQYAGLIEYRHNRALGVYVGLYVAAEAGFDASGGKYAAVCETHSTTCNFETLSAARSHLSCVDWCETCMNGGVDPYAD